ncbi:Hpt domain-containing protein [Arthrobacter sp. D3-16]
MTPTDGHALPLLDPAVLETLRADLDQDEAIWKVFVQNFLAQLQPRVQQIRLTLTTGDPAGAMDAVLSLKTSSQMMGAERLAGLALELEVKLRAEARADSGGALPRLAADHLRPIKQCAEQTRHLLEALLHK